ncbi:Plasmid segregation centromere-binding protein ParR, partial [Dysosmobacter welbionis]
GRPPSCSGQTGTRMCRSARSEIQGWSLETPSYRQRAPSRQAEIRIRIFSPPVHGLVLPQQLLIELHSGPGPVVGRQHRLQAVPPDPRLTQRRQKAVHLV